ncbi:unnamed protein product [Bursaphelenchus okinawaensis]|uniref:non-specific serine/threonine protein kinase n=1 Tax=Bursaphelenchus okinawaensis TaxID=465554 RepID=A0A811LL95_9BILA|nr:unnamed protein product [Bursaphelenchus okinawaensis]CAG9124485.1 unnamed protein product [Bursaphelenchus okinawaensis]
MNQTFGELEQKIREASRSESSDRVCSEGYKPIPKWSANPDDFRFLCMLGGGSFGDVVKAKNVVEKQYCAVKLIDLFAGTRYIIDEIQTISNLSHPNLVSNHAVALINKTAVFIVMPLYRSLEDLYERNIKLKIASLRRYGSSRLRIKQVSPVSEATAGEIVHQLLTGLSFMHSHGYVHRDLKSANTMLDEDATIKLTDFGMARKFDNRKSKYGQLYTPAGTACYMAPEVTLRMNRLDYQSYDIRAETWSIGAVMCELLTGALPFEHILEMDAKYLDVVKGIRNQKHLNWSDMFSEEVQENFVSQISPECKKFIDKCLVGNFMKRRTCEELLKLDWIRQFKHSKEHIKVELLREDVIRSHDAYIRDCNYESWVPASDEPNKCTVNILFNPLGNKMFYFYFDFDLDCKIDLRAFQQEARIQLLKLTYHKLISTTVYLSLADELSKLMLKYALKKDQAVPLIYPLAKTSSDFDYTENLAQHAMIIVKATRRKFEAYLQEEWPHLMNEYIGAGKDFDVNLDKPYDSKDEGQETDVELNTTFGVSSQASTSSMRSSSLSQTSGTTSEGSSNSGRKRRRLLKRGRGISKAIFGKGHRKSSSS